jgi:hypothetical protein
MAFKVTKVFKEHYPALRFIGKRYTNDDRGECGGFGPQWNEWVSEDKFSSMCGFIDVPAFKEGTIGLMTMNEDMSEFTYWIGMFFPVDTYVPSGYDYIDLPESDIGIGWVCGSMENGEIFGAEPSGAVCEEIEKQGLGEFRNDIAGRDSGIYCIFELYNCPRFTEKDSDGNVTLDYGNYIKNSEVG